MSRNAVKRARPLTGSLPLAIVCPSLMSWPRNRGYGQPPNEMTDLLSHTRVNPGYYSPRKLCNTPASMAA